MQATNNQAPLFCVTLYVLHRLMMTLSYGQNCFEEFRNDMKMFGRDSNIIEIRIQYQIEMFHQIAQRPEVNGLAL